MSGQRAAAEPYATRFETEATGVDGTSVWLETSYFFPETGGQPADRGRIGDVDVVDVQFADGELVHVLESKPPFRAGHRVLCSIDWAFRMYCMRAHTASHVLYGAARRVLEDIEYCGFEIGDETVHVDVETSTAIDDDVLVELDELVNRAVWESRPVSWETRPVAEARERETVVFDDRIDHDAVSKGQVRLVTIGADDDNGTANGSRDPWDVAACSGTHVRNTREIGPVTILGQSTIDNGGTRVEFAVGPGAIERRSAEKRATLTAERTLDAEVSAIPSELERLAAERERNRRECVETALDTVSAIERNGARWLVTTVEGFEPESLGDVVQEIETDGADVLVVVGETEYTFAVVRSAGSPPATAIVDALTTEFGGGGGGSDRFAQCGGFDAPPADVIESLRQC